MGARIPLRGDYDGDALRRLARQSKDGAHHPGLGDAEGILARYRITGNETILETASIDVASGNQLVDRVRRLLLISAPEQEPVL